MVLYECPNSYFEDWLGLIHKRLFDFLYFKKFNIVTNPDDVSIIELEACSLLDIEIEKFHNHRNEQELKNREKQHGNRSNSSNKLPHKGR
jgi:hypothetical protein